MSEKFPIRHMSNLLGVPPSTLRTWEHRYKLFASIDRSAKGQRQYSANDLAFALRLKNYLDEGLGIRDAILKLRCLGFDFETSGQSVKKWQQQKNAALLAIQDFDQVSLDRIFHNLLNNYDEDLVMLKMIVPIFDILGKNWDKNPAGIAEECFACVYFYNKLGSIYNYRIKPVEGNRLITCCLPGERHEIGLLIFCLTLISQGFQPLYLGSNFPISQYLETVQKTDSKAMVLSGRTDNIRKDQNMIEKLMNFTSVSPVPTFFGGPEPIEKTEFLKNIKLIPIGNDFQKAICIMGKYLSNDRSIK
ncbi:MAG: MerR family transcriptional regulator [Magnetococcales bacterium]|nr:MerR family transcriptional regulator [Magnetococcales bacterium]